MVFTKLKNSKINDLNLAPFCHIIVVHRLGWQKNNSKNKSKKLKETIEVENQNEQKLGGYIVEIQENIYIVAVKYEFIRATP